MNILDQPLDPSYILQKKRSLKRQLSAAPGLVPKKIALLSGSTIGEIKNSLEIFLLANGIQPTFWEGEYARFYEDLVYDSGALKEFAPDFIYIHISQRNIRQWPLAGEEEAAVEAKLASETEHFTQAARAALAALREAETGLLAGVTPDAVLTDVEGALEALAELTGRAVREDVVERIFSRFCVGK